MISFWSTFYEVKPLLTPTLDLSPRPQLDLSAVLLGRWALSEHHSRLGHLAEQIGNVSRPNVGNSGCNL